MPAHSQTTGTNSTAASTAPDDQLLFMCYKRCSTCAKARHWLEEHDIVYTERDIKGDNPTAAELTDWHQRSGLPIKRFFNTSGQKYRELNSTIGLKDRLPEMTDEEAIALLATDGMLIKRPIIVSANIILVGFQPKVWESELIGRARTVK